MVIPVYDEDGTARGGSRAWAVWSLLGINVAVFLLLFLLPAALTLAAAYNLAVVPAALTGAPGVSELGLSVPPAITLLTYTFIHGSWLHLAANMIFLWVLGDDVEIATGHLRFLLFYVLCGIAAVLLHVASDTGSVAPVIGASGAVSGIVGAYLLLRPNARVTVLVLGILTLRLKAYWLIALWIAWQVFNVWWPLVETRTAYWGHIGGFAAGLLLILILRRRGVRVMA